MSGSRELINLLNAQLRNANTLISAITYIQSHLIQKYNSQLREACNRSFAVTAAITRENKGQYQNRNITLRYESDVISYTIG